MRIPAARPDCGPLLELSQIQRQLRLGPPVFEGERTITIAHIIGTAGRVHDFDGCFRPRHDRLRKRIDEITEAAPPGLDEPIEVVRVDRAYFVADGHKRVAIARRAEREFIDARVSHLPSPYALSPEVELEAIERTAREGEFRRHSGLADGVPEARFAASELGAYGELLLAVQSYAYDRVTALGRALSPAEAARLWFEEKYRPTVAAARDAARDLVGALTETDLFLALHRQERSAWGGTCGEPECIADMLLAEQRRTAASARSVLDRVLGRDPEPRQAVALLLPLAPDAESAGDDAAER